MFVRDSIKLITNLNAVMLYLQPIPLDRFIIIDAEATHAGIHPL